ncbi:MAG TPA: glycosyltransferase family 39 protein [Terriglobales bacterium]|nr:glycosyltransferase family 39 protein [Terriglobales bacterium]
MSARFVAITSLLSLSSFLWFFFRHEILLYGDAVAHINIARRVFDSMHPGPLQFGTVWLPFPHLLMIPFIINHQMWTSGWGASIPSMIAYELGVVGIYKLVSARTGNWPALLAAAIYGLNPNLLYLQSTAMTEPIFLATFIWAMVYLDRYWRALHVHAEEAAAKALEYCAVALAGAILTRYDGWVYSAVFGIVVVIKWWRWRRGNDDAAMALRIRRSLIEFMALCALAPTLWLAQNYALSAKPLDFMNGPYSARAIEARSTAQGQPPHPGTGSLTTSTIFFLKAAKLNVSGGWLEPFFFLVVVLGVAYAGWRFGRFGLFLLLLLPVPFYAYSIAYGNVPIFMPVWWPHSYYNVRYGLELLPAFAVFAGVAFYACSRWDKTVMRRAAHAVIVAIIAASYIHVMLESPISLREARANSWTRMRLENRLAEVLQHTEPNSKILMATKDYVGALQDAGIPLRRVIWEGVHTEWEESLASPAKYANYVVAIQGDEVAYSTRLFPQDLKKWAEFQTADKPRVTVYQVERGSATKVP